MSTVGFEISSVSWGPRMLCTCVGIYKGKERHEKAKISHLWLILSLCKSKKWRQLQGCKLLEH